MIIDGQQRLSTMSLLLCAIRDFLNTPEHTKNRITDYLVNRHHEGSADYLKFVPTNSDREIYKKIVTSQTIEIDEQHQMISAYRYFLKMLQEYNGDDAIQPDALFDVIAQNLQVVMINLDDMADDPHLIYESLNNKGQTLEEADLVRNYVMMRFQHSDSPGGEQQRVYDEYWHPIEVVLPGKMTQFLRHYIHKDGVSVKRNLVYASVKETLSKIKDTQTLISEIKNIHVHSRTYEFLLDPGKHQNPVVQSHLAMFDELEMTTCYPFLLRLFQSFNMGKATLEEVVNSLRLIESFSIRRQVCGVPSNSLDQIFVSWCKQYTTPVDVSLWKFMKEGIGNRRWPSDDEFGACLLNRPLYGTKVTLPLLKRIEESFGHKEKPDMGSVTIEHIMPQALSPEWKQYLGEEAQIIYDKYCNTIGNLTLTAYNSELSNDLFQKKKEWYNSSNIELNKAIATFEDWKEDQIVKRAKSLSSIAKNIWRGLESKT